MILIQYGDVLSSSLVSETVVFTVKPRAFSRDWVTLEPVLGLGEVNVKANAVINKRAYSFENRHAIYLRINELRETQRMNTKVFQMKCVEIIHERTIETKEAYFQAFFAIQNTEQELQDLDRFLVYNRNETE